MSASCIGAGECARAQHILSVMGWPELQKEIFTTFIKHPC